MYCERCDKLGFDKCHCWFNHTGKAHHGYITHFSYTQRWERKFNVIWTIKESK